MRRSRRDGLKIVEEVREQAGGAGFRREFERSYAIWGMWHFDPWAVRMTFDPACASGHFDHTLEMPSTSTLPDLLVVVAPPPSAPCPDPSRRCSRAQPTPQSSPYPPVQQATTSRNRCTRPGGHGDPMSPARTGRLTCCTPRARRALLRAVRRDRTAREMVWGA
jgi:hypothetical protein